MFDDDNKTLWCGNLPDQVTEENLYELFLQVFNVDYCNISVISWFDVSFFFIIQAGPLEQVRIAKDRDGRQKNFAFITYRHAVSVPYAMFIFKGTALYHKTLNLQSRGQQVPLPPPIRCYGPEAPQEFIHSGNKICSQFADMASRLEEEDLTTVRALREPELDPLVMASLQGNWRNRHHPYNRHNDLRPRERDHRERDRDNRFSNHQRDRRNRRSRGNYRRD